VNYFLIRLFFGLGLVLMFMVSPAPAQNPLPAELPEIATDLSPNTNILRFGLHTSRIGNFDPAYAKGSEDYTYADMVFNSILRYVPGNSSQLEPDVALKMPEFIIQHGKQIWTVQLRSGIFFHGGPHTPPYELTAEDVVYSLKKMADPLRSSKFGKYAGMKFEMAGSHTLEIIVEKPMSPLFFFPLLANREGGFIVSKQAIETGGYDNFKQHPVGTGPFMFSRYTAQDKLVLTANEHYFRGKPLLRGVEVHFLPDNNRREAAFKEGLVDVIYGVGDPGWIEKMETWPGTIVDVFGPGFTGLFHFNTSIKPMDDIRVRQAICLALDRELFLKASSKKLVKQIFAPMSSEFLPGGISNEKTLSLGLHTGQDLDKARKLLAQAGYAKGFSMDLATSEKRIYRKIYGILQQQLKKIGIRVNLQVMAHSQMHKHIRQNLNPIVLYFTFRPNADAYLRGFFHSDSIVQTGIKPHTNFSHYTKIDKLLDDALQSVHPKRQINLWEQAQIRILHDAMVYPLFDINQCTVRRDTVDYGNLLISTLAGYPLFSEKTRIITPN
jgi:peptide/nickel transport system substrate-binding protein